MSKTAKSMWEVSVTAADGWRWGCYGYLSAVKLLHGYGGEEPERRRPRHYQQWPSGRLHLRRNAGNPWSTIQTG